MASLLYPVTNNQASGQNRTCCVGDGEDNRYNPFRHVSMKRMVQINATLFNNNPEIMRQAYSRIENFDLDRGYVDAPPPVEAREEALEERKDNATKILAIASIVAITVAGIMTCYSYL